MTTIFTNRFFIGLVNRKFLESAQNWLQFPDCGFLDLSPTYRSIY